MNIAIIGSGGREHSICHQLSKSKLVSKIYCLPGNAGTKKIANNISLDTNNFFIIYKKIKLLKIDIVIIGPEQPLVGGLVDYLKKKKVKVFGPSKYAAKLEGSKAFVKNICKKYKIPTANFKTCTNINQVKKFLKKIKMPIVVKADGIAAGKGVIICKSSNQVLNNCREIFKGKFKSSKKLVLEEFLSGEELSMFFLVDKKNFLVFGSAQDHKRVGEKDQGPNTGGMGAYSPAPILSKKLEVKIIEKIVKPTLKHLKKNKNPFTGFLYAGLMIRNGDPFLIEYNVRMGDPECQVILPRLQTDFAKIILYALKNQLNKIQLKWVKKKCMTVVLCSKGYPGKYKKNIEIKNLEKIKENKDNFVFHAGTKKENNKIFSIGGRVLNIISLGFQFKLIRKKIMKNLNIINWKNGFFRRDIGWRVINK